jgi:hypothetical protein
MTAAISCDFSGFSGPSRDESTLDESSVNPSRDEFPDGPSWDEFMYESCPSRDEYGYESKNEFPSREESGTH